MIGETLDTLTIFQLVGNLGFPIIITAYLLHSFEKKIENLEDAIKNLANALNINNKGM